MAKVERHPGITNDLGKSEEEAPRAEIRMALQDAIRILDAMGTALKMHGRLEPIINSIKSLEEKVEALSGTKPKGQTWAQVAAAQYQTLGPTVTQKTAVRAWLQGAEGKMPEELLAAVKPTIQGAYPVRWLHSSDVEVMV